jgi:hypothetical protein
MNLFSYVHSSLLLYSFIVFSLLYRKKVEKTIAEKTNKGQEIGERVQKMQSLMQQAAAQAAHQIAQEQGA